MSGKLEWRDARQVMAGGLQAAGLSVGTGVAHVGASSQPTASRTIPRSGHIHESHGEFSGHPGETITVGANGVIQVRRGTGVVTVKPDRGYVLARFNPKAGRFEGVKGASFSTQDYKYTYALVKATSVPHISGISVEKTVRGGRTMRCTTRGRTPAGCQLLTVSAPANASLRVTVSYAGAPKFTQTFQGAVNKYGKPYVTSFPVTYRPSAKLRHGVVVTVTVAATLADGADAGTSTTTFVVK